MIDNLNNTVEQQEAELNRLHAEQEKNKAEKLAGNDRIDKLLSENQKLKDRNLVLERCEKPKLDVLEKCFNQSKDILAQLDANLRNTLWNPFESTDKILIKKYSTCIERLGELNQSVASELDQI